MELFVAKTMKLLPVHPKQALEQEPIQPTVQVEVQETLQEFIQLCTQVSMQDN